MKKVLLASRTDINVMANFINEFFKEREASSCSQTDVADERQQ